MKTYAIYLTDLFCGDLNYSFVTRIKVKASTERGAVSKVTRHIGGPGFRAHIPGEIYHSKSRITGLVIDGIIGDSDDDTVLSYDYSESETI